MNIKQYTHQKLEKSAEDASRFWKDVKNRFSKEPLSQKDVFEVIDVQEISDDCIDLVMLRKNKEIDLVQLEHCRIVAEKRFFKKPKIKMHFTSGPFAEEFFNEKEYSKNT